MSDPYASLAKPIASADPYAGIGAVADVAPPVKFTVKNLKGKDVSFDVPDGTDDATVRKLAMKATGEKRYIRSAVQRLDTPTLAPEPSDHSALSGFAEGVRDFGDRLSHRIDQIPGVGAAGDWLEAHSPFTSPGTADARTAAHRAEMADNSRTGWQTVGQIAGSLPLAALPGGPLAQGALNGAIMSDKDDAVGVGVDAAIGGVTSKAGSKVLGTLGSLAGGVKDKGLQALNKAGVPLTLGQIARASNSKVAAGLESAGRRLPFLKQAVMGAEDRGQKAYYDAVVKRIGVDIPKDITPGHDALEYAGKSLSSEYQALLPKLNISADPKLASGLASVGADVKGIAPSSYNQFKSILKTAGLTDTGGVNLTGAKMQQADRVLRTQSERFARGGPNDQVVADGLNQVRQQLRSLAQRQNPEYAEQLSSLNKRWRELAVARKAAGDPNGGSGVFTPAQYSRAAKGSRSNRELTRAANMNLTNRSPDSGTAESMSLGLLAAGAAPNPLLAVGAAGIAPYTEAGQKALNAIAFAPRGRVGDATSTTLKTLSRYAPQVVVPAIVAGNE